MRVIALHVSRQKHVFGDVSMAEHNCQYNVPIHFTKAITQNIKTPGVLRKFQEIKRTAINHCFRILIIYGSQSSEIKCTVSQSLLSHIWCLSTQVVFVPACFCGPVSKKTPDG